MEEFKTIIDFPNYKISNFGRIFNEKTKKFLNPHVDNVGYLQFNIRKGEGRKYFRIHRLVALYFIENLNNHNCVDHIDHNKTNNHVDNLRWCSYSQNFMNKLKNKKKTSSIYKGVYYGKKNKGWCAQIVINSKKIYLGTFQDEKEAAKIYDTKAKELFGKFAGLNFIE